VPAHTEPYANVLETIGWTPLIRLNKLTQGIRTPLYAKAEFFNPGGSVKDRIGLAMIEAAEREGRLRPGGLIVEATSGNTGVGLALAAAVKGYRCIFTMPDKMSQEKARLLRALGAEVIITPTAVPPDHPENYIVKGRTIAAAHPNAIFADQHYNPVNPEVHYRTTGPEIWEQTAGRITHFVCAPGTGGTVSGAGRFLKERNPKLRVVAGDPLGSIYTEYARTRQKTEGHPYKVEGIGGDKIPTSLHWDVIDEWITVPDKDAMLSVRRLAKEEGLFCGGSTGVNLVSALEVARRVDDPQALVVTVLCDTGERYLSKVYNDEWLRENQILDTDRARARGEELGRAAPHFRRADRYGASGAQSHEHLQRVPAPGARRRRRRGRRVRTGAHGQGVGAARHARPARPGGDGRAVSRGGRGSTRRAPHRALVA